MIIKKSPAEIEKIAASGQIVARCLQMLESKAVAGTTTEELDAAADKFIRSQGGIPVFKGYRGFPKSICTSPNSLVVHGIPDSYELKRGDILSLDVGVEVDGWVGDAAITVPVGQVSAVASKLLKATKESLSAAVDACQPGNRMGDISNAIQQRIEKDGFSVIRSLCGHGVGRDLHEDPEVRNYGEAGRGTELEPGMVLAIEPMVNAGAATVKPIGDDNWAIYSSDGSLAAHFEHSVAITEDGPRILTPWHTTGI